MQQFLHLPMNSLSAQSSLIPDSGNAQQTGPLPVRLLHCTILDRVGRPMITHGTPLRHNDVSARPRGPAGPANPSNHLEAVHSNRAGHLEHLGTVHKHTQGGWRTTLGGGGGIVGVPLPSRYPGGGVVFVFAGGGGGPTIKSKAHDVVAQNRAKTMNCGCYFGVLKPCHSKFCVFLILHYQYVCCIDSRDAMMIFG